MVLDEQESCPSEGFKIVTKSTDQGSLDSGCLVAANLMFEWNIGWYLCNLKMFLGPPPAQKFTYIMEACLTHEQHKVKLLADKMKWWEEDTERCWFLVSKCASIYKQYLCITFLILNVV